MSQFERAYCILWARILIVVQYLFSTDRQVFQSGCLSLRLDSLPAQIRLQDEWSATQERVVSYLLFTLFLFSIHLLPSPVHPIGFSFCFFPGFLAIFTLLSSNNNNNTFRRTPCVRILSLKRTYEHTELSEWPVHGGRSLIF